jgi:hypothetical protein
MYSISQAILEQTFRHFRACGAGARECQALWTSSWNLSNDITKVVHPAHRAHAGGFSVDTSWLNAFWLELAATGHGIQVQVHTHPAAAFHSSTDDAFPIVHTPGFLSLVIPRYGIGEVGFRDAFLAEITEDGSWREVEIKSRLQIVE